MGGNPGVDWALFAKQMDSAMGYGPTPLPPAIINVSGRFGGRMQHPLGGCLLGLSIALKGPRHVTNQWVQGSYLGQPTGQTTC